MFITPNDTILFTGDSVTDCGRLPADTHNQLGSGYVYFIAARLQALLASPELKIFNRGVSGSRVRDLVKRMESDLLSVKPTIISVLIGINDTWRRYDTNDLTDANSFERDYRLLLETIRSSSCERVVLLEPFLLHIPDDRHLWREDLNPKIDVTRRMALEFQAELLPLDGLFAQAAGDAPASYWAADGVHPTPAGHSLIAQAWLEKATLEQSDKHQLNHK